MRKVLVGLMCLFAVSVSTAQMVVYLDQNALPFMYSNKVGGTTVYMDKNSKPIAYQISPIVSGPQIEPINTPSLVFPMVRPSLSGAVTNQALPSLPSLPELPTLRGF